MTQRDTLKSDCKRNAYGLIPNSGNKLFLVLCTGNKTEYVIMPHEKQNLKYWAVDRELTEH